MKMFQVTCTRIMNGYAYVEAENKEEAMEKADDMLNNEDVAFEFGEETVDYAEEISKEAFADDESIGYRKRVSVALSNNEESFEVITLSREDFKARGFNADNVSDEVMEKIASRLADILTEETFWYALDEQATTNKIPTLLREPNAVWKDTKESFVASIIVGVSSANELDNTPYTDEDIFFYCANEEEYQKLFNEDNGEDFYLIHEDFLVTD